MLKYICKYDNFIKESINFKRQFVIKDPETGELYSVEIPDEKKHELIRMERTSEAIIRLIHDIRDTAKLNGRRIIAHGNDNKVATDLFVKWITRKEISPSEYEFIKKTAIGNLKLLGVGTAEIFLPGSSVTLPMILIAAGKNNINLFPDAWDRIKKEKRDFNINKDRSIRRTVKLQNDIARYSGESPIEKTEQQKKLEAIIKKIEELE